MTRAEIEEWLRGERQVEGIPNIRAIEAEPHRFLIIYPTPGGILITGQLWLEDDNVGLTLELPQRLPEDCAEALEFLLRENGRRLITRFVMDEDHYLMLIVDHPSGNSPNSEAYFHPAGVVAFLGIGAQTVDDIQEGLVGAIRQCREGGVF